MRYRRIMLVSAWLTAGAALAQVPSGSHEDWALRRAGLRRSHDETGTPTWAMGEA